MSKNKAYGWNELLDIVISDSNELDVIKINDMKKFEIKSDGVTSELIMETALIRPINSVNNLTHFSGFTYFRCMNGHDYHTRIDIDKIISINLYIVKSFDRPATQIVKIKFENKHMNIRIGERNKS